MNKFKYYFISFLSITLIACQDKTKTSEQFQDVLAFIEYPAWVDTLDCSKFGADWKPYPCLEVDKKTMIEIDSIYGKPLTNSIDTFYYGKKKNENTYYPNDPEIEEMILKVPFAKVTYTFRKEMGYALILYFIEHNKQNLVFYGYRINPITRMME